MKRLFAFTTTLGVLAVTHSVLAVIVQQSPDPAVADGSAAQRLFFTYPGLIALAYLSGFVAVVSLLVLTLNKTLRVNAMAKTALIIFYSMLGILLLFGIVTLVISPLTLIVVTFQHVFVVGIIPSAMLLIALFLMIGALHEMKKKALMIYVIIVTTFFFVGAAAMGAFYLAATRVRAL